MSTTSSQWVAGARPRTLPASIAPVLIGTGAAIEAGGFVWWKALLALVVAVSLQVGCNYANDYSDGIRGTDTDRVGPFRLVGSGAADPGTVRLAAFASFAVGALAGLVLVFTSAWWLVLVGAVAIAAAWFYTGGSKPYGYNALGEVSVFVFFGPVACLGTTYVQTLSLTWPAIAGALAIGAFTCMILVSNNLRDIPTDRASGKRTLSVLIGDRGSRLFYLGLAILGFGTVAGLAVSGYWWTLLAFGALPLCVRPVRTLFAGAVGRDLIPVLARTSLLDLVFGVLLAVGLALS